MSNNRIEKKKKELRRYNQNVMCVKRLERKLDIINDKIIGLKSPTITDMPKGGTPVTLDDLLADKQELELRIERLKMKGKKLKHEILEQIDSIEDYRYAEILELHFIDGKGFETIANEQRYTLRHVYRLYGEGVKLLTLNGR